jgi:hypothetical protein
MSDAWLKVHAYRRLRTGVNAEVIFPKSAEVKFPTFR